MSTKTLSRGDTQRMALYFAREYAHADPDEQPILRVAMPIALSRVVQEAYREAKQEQTKHSDNTVRRFGYDRHHLAEATLAAARAWIDGDDDAPCREVVHIREHRCTACGRRPCIC